ncbi:Uncharacterized protein APZ42_022067 [Daphnia magna]|uniref:Uncharacterized protein n=1 Tax=Daphnia magna TaxID=35525 RepID=A0A0P5ZQC3_9CRUS|nr:Uncharacterized protein APZ42_022067 [Daphnia magna]
MKCLMMIAAFLMIWATICLANPAEAEVTKAIDGDVHDLVGEEHFLKKYKKHRAYHPVPVYGPIYHPVHVYHPVPVYHPAPFYYKKFHKG